MSLSPKNVAISVSPPLSPAGSPPLSPVVSLSLEIPTRSHQEFARAARSAALCEMAKENFFLFLGTASIASTGFGMAKAVEVISDFTYDNLEHPTTAYVVAVLSSTVAVTAGMFLSARYVITPLFVQASEYRMSQIGSLHGGAFLQVNSIFST